MLDFAAMPATVAPQPALRRSISQLDATAMVVGTIIGASIFVQPSEITTRAPSVESVILVWALAGVLTAFGALVCAELSSAFPDTGGVYVYLTRAFSPTVAFLWGWAMFWAMHSGIIAAIAVVFARYVGYFVELTPAATKAVAIAAIAGLSAVNYVGVRPGSRLQTVLTIGKVGAIAALIVLAFTAGRSVPQHFVADPAASIPAGEIVMAVAAGLFAFGGWHMVTYAAGETDRPERTIPNALFAGVAIVTVCYIALNLAYLYVLPLASVAASTRVAADAAEAIVGPRGGSVISLVVLVSTLGGLNGIILSGPRVYFAMARDRLVVPWIGEVHPRFRTPARAIVLQAAWSSALVLLGTYRSLFTRVVYTEWIFFAVMAYGLMRLRRRADYRPAYRIWAYPITPVLFIAGSLVVVAKQIAADPASTAAVLALVAAGIPVYHASVSFARSAHRADR
jgi:basic amino acid/polyamine antiporter, APA family